MAMIPWWIHYPNVNNEIINLDWILQISNENTDKIENFIGVNTIKYADPILWDITSQYEANTIVVDPQTGDAYISTKAVPYGVALSNDGYWTKIYNYASEIHTFREQIAADEQLSTTATAPRSVDDLVFLNGLLYRVTAPMIAGDSYVEGSNCVKTTINAELLRLHTMISGEIEARIEADATETLAREGADSALGGRIDGEIQAREDADTALGGRIDGEIQAREDADTALGGRIDGEIQAREDADTAINALIGVLTNLSTTDKSSLVAAINEVYNLASSNKSLLDGKTIQIFGDSLSDETATNLAPNWVVKLRSMFPDTVINNNSASGRKMIELPNILYNINSFTADIVIVYLGTNDFGVGTPFGDWTTGNVNSDFCAALVYILNQIATKNTKKCQVYFITPPCRSDMYVNTLQYTLEMYRAAIRGFCKGYGCHFINGEDIPFLNRFYPANYYNNDMVHPSYVMSDIVCNYFVNGILSNGDDQGGAMGNISSIPLDSTNFTGSLLFGMDGEKLFIRGKIIPAQSISGIVPISTDINEMLDDVYGAIKPIFHTGNYYDASGTQNFTTYFDETSNKLMIATVTAIPQGSELFIDYEVSPTWCNIGTTE